MTSTITLIGSAGKMGQAFSKLFTARGIEVLEVDIGTKLTAQEAIPQANIIIFSVPITATPALIEELAPLAKKGSLLTDFTSVKSPATKALREYAPDTCEILGLHPMFGPSMVADLKKQVFAACPIRPGELSQWLLNFFRAEGALVKEIDAEDHDQMMSVIQGLTHISAIATAMALKELDVDVQKSLDFSSPVYRLRLEMVGRILSQSAPLYAEIAIENPLTKKSLKAYLNAIQQLMKYISSDDEQGFIKAFNEASEFLGDFTDEAYQRTTELIQRSKDLL